MSVFKFVISDGKKSLQVEKDQKDAPILDKKIGDTISGSFLGLEGYELQITGGTDKDGFPMRKDVEGAVKKRIILTKGTGFHAKRDGLRKRKILRGNTINQDIMQVNCKVAKKGDKEMADLLGIKKGEKAAEKEEAKPEGEEKEKEAPKDEKGEEAKDGVKEDVKEEPKQEGQKEGKSDNATDSEKSKESSPDQNPADVSTVTEEKKEPENKPDSSPASGKNKSN